jgi:hypothetical protein
MEKAGRMIYEGLLIAWDGFWAIWVAELLWLVFCLPLVTMPLAFAGLYGCAHALAHGESISWRTFFFGMKRHLGAALRWSGFNLLVILLLAFYVWFFSTSKGGLVQVGRGMLSGVPAGLLALWLLFNQFTFPFMLAQENPSYLNALRNSLVMFLKWPGVTTGFTLFNLAVLALSLWLRFPWLVFSGSLTTLMACLCVKSSVDQTIDARPSMEKNM